MKGAPYGRGDRFRCAAQVSGRIAYNSETFDSFFPQRTAAYVDQVDCITINMFDASATFIIFSSIC